MFCHVSVYDLQSLNGWKYTLQNTLYRIYQDGDRCILSSSQKPLCNDGSMSSPMRCYGPAYCKAHAVTRVIARVCASSSASCTELKRYMDRLCCPCTRQPWMGRWLQHGINIFVQTDLHYECMHERIRYGMHALICVLFDCLNWVSVSLTSQTFSQWQSSCLTLHQATGLLTTYWTVAKQKLSEMEKVAKKLPGSKDISLNWIIVLYILHYLRVNAINAAFTGRLNAG